MIQAPVAETASVDALRWAVVAIEVVAILLMAAWLIRRAHRAARDSIARSPETRAVLPSLPAANRAARRNATPRGGTARVATPTATPMLPRSAESPARATLQGGGPANAASRDPGLHVRFDEPA